MNTITIQIASIVLFSFLFFIPMSEYYVSNVSEPQKESKSNDNELSKNLADYWPMFHRNLARTGFTEKKGILREPIRKWNYNIGMPFSGSEPAIGDIDNDGMTEIVIGSQDNRTYAFNGNSGALKWSFDAGHWSVFNSPAIGDIDGDGKVEIAITSDDGYLYALNGTSGKLKWKFFANTVCGIGYPSPAITDLDSDGKNEVVIIGSKSIFVLNGETGSEKWNHTEAASLSCSTPAIGDVDNDGVLEIVAEYNGSLYVIDGKSYAIQWTYPASMNYGEGSPAVADIDNDGKMEIVVSDGESNVYALNGGSGKIKWSHNTPGIGKVFSSPAIGDINNDGNQEVVVSNKGVDGILYALDGLTGKAEWEFDPRKIDSPVAHIETSPALCDVDNDGDIEVIISSKSYNSQLYSLNGTTGEVEWNYSLGDTNPWSPALGDIDDDGYIEIAIISGKLEIIDGISPLTANITAIPQIGDAPLKVTLNTSISGGKPPYSYLWEFGDGSKSTQSNTTHTYTDPGTYNVSLKIMDSLSKNASAQVIIIVNSPQQPITNLTLTILIIVPVAILILLVFLILFLRRRRKTRETASSRDTPKQIHGNKK